MRFYLLGGLKTKNVDVVVTKNGLGPVMAVSCKGATRAFRNLTGYGPLEPLLADDDVWDLLFANQVLVLPTADAG